MRGEEAMFLIILCIIALPAAALADYYWGGDTACECRP